MKALQHLSKHLHNISSSEQPILELFNQYYLNLIKQELFNHEIIWTKTKIIRNQN